MESKIKFHLVNWMLHKDKTIELEGDSNLYLIKGQNKKGKTSVLNAILSLMTVRNIVPEPLTRGELAGVVEGDIYGPGGIYNIKMDISKTNTTFQMYDPRGVKISRINDMRKVFNYNSMTTEDFIKKSYSAAGRREQIKILASLLDLDDKMVFEKLLNDVDTVKGKLFIARKKAKSEYETLESQIEANDVSDEDAKLYNENSKVDEYLKQLRDKELELSKIPSKEEELEMLEENHTTEINKLNEKSEELKAENKSIDDEVILLENRIKDLKKKKEAKEAEIIKTNHKIIDENSAYKENVKASNKREDTTEELAAIVKEIGKIEADKSKVLRIGGRIDVYNELKAKEPKLKEKYDTAEAELQKARDKMTTIIKKISVPGYSITVEDDTIFIDDFPLNEAQVNGASLTIAVSAILAKVNSDSPILIVGQLSELDDNSLAELEKVAKDNNCIIIGDYIENNITDVVVEGFVNEGIDEATLTMDNTGKPHEHTDNLDEI